MTSGHAPGATSVDANVAALLAMSFMAISIAQVSESQELRVFNWNGDMHSFIWRKEHKTVGFQGPFHKRPRNKLNCVLTSQAAGMDMVTFL